MTVSARVCRETARERDELANWKNRATHVLALWKAETLRERDEGRAAAGQARGAGRRVGRPARPVAEPQFLTAVLCAITAAGFSNAADDQEGR